MSILLALAFLFFLGSVSGWVLELFFRKFFSGSNPEHKWINPGFCVGPYVPLYGFGLCFLYGIAALGERLGLDQTAAGQAGVFLCMALSMTLIEYIAGLVLLKWMKLRLWDYSRRWGNIQGLICPLFSLFWALLGAIYYYDAHPRILLLLEWLGQHLAFSFVIGCFFGVFAVDVCYSAHLVTRLKRFADENGVIVKYENLKYHIRKAQERSREKIHFVFAFHSEHPLTEHLREAHDALEKILEKRHSA